MVERVTGVPVEPIAYSPVKSALEEFARSGSFSIPASRTGIPRSDHEHLRSQVTALIEWRSPKPANRIHAQA